MACCNNCNDDKGLKGHVTVDDVIDLFRPLDSEELTKAENLLPIVEDQLKLEAYNSGKNLEYMIDHIPGYRNTYKSVVVDIVARNLMTSTTAEPLSQYSESAMGYSFSGTFLNPGGGLFIKKSELAKLGFGRQRIRGLELYDISTCEAYQGYYYHSPRPGDPWY